MKLQAAQGQGPKVSYVQAYLSSLQCLALALASEEFNICWLELPLRSTAQGKACSFYRECWCACVCTDTPAVCIYLHMETRRQPWEWFFRHHLQFERKSDVSYYPEAFQVVWTSWPGCPREPVSPTSPVLGL